MAIIYTPLFTYTGLNKISKALSDGSTIQLTHLAVGDCINDLEYNVTQDDTALNNEVVRINISTIKYTDMVDSNNILMSIEGLMTPLESPAMTIREYGIYDNEGDLIIISRFPDKSTIEPGTPRSNFVFKTNIKLLRGQQVFIEDIYPEGYITVEEFNAHASDLNNPHNVIHTQIPGLENLDNTSVANKPLNQELTDLFKYSKFTTGFKDRTSSKISNTNNTIKLEVVTPITIYKHGVRYIIENNLELIIGNLNSHGYIGYNPTTGLLHYIGETPTFGEDVLVAWYYANSTQGIIWCNDERHSATINSEDHRLRHNELGTLWNSGGILTKNDGHKLHITDISISDEDLDFTIVHSDTPTLPYEQVLINAKLPVLYINNGRYMVAGGTSIENWLYGATRAYYNNIDTGLVEVDNDKYINYYLIYTTDQYSPAKLIMGRNVFNSMSVAEEESIVSYGIPMLEIVTAYRITLHISDVYTNNSKSDIVNIHRLENSGLENSTANTNHSLFINRFNGIQHDMDVISDFEIITQPKAPTIEVELTGTFKGVSVLDNDTHLAILDGYQSDRSNMPVMVGGAIGDEFLRSEYIGTDLGTTANKYYFATKADNGKIYAPPYVATRVLEIDPNTNTTSLVGTDYGAGAYKWGKFILAPNGKLYAPPAGGAGQTLKLDPTTGVTSLVGTNWGASGEKWFGGALAANGKIYCTPALSASQVLVIDPSNDTTSLIGTAYGTGSYKWIDGILAPNGKIYCPPCTPGQVLCIDPTNDTTSLIGTDYGNSVATGGKWFGGALAANGKIYCPPGSVIGKTLCIDPITNTTSLIGTDYGTGIHKYGSATLWPNGKIYSAPFGATQVLEIDPNTNTTRLVGSYYNNTYKWLNTILADNGKMYGVPYNTNYVLKLDFIDKTENRPSIITKFIGNTYITTVRKAGHGVLAYNGCIYCPPMDGNYVIKINPELQTVMNIGGDYGGTSDAKWLGGILHPNGKIYCPPHNFASQVLVIDPTTDTMSLIGTVWDSTPGKWVGGALAANGKIYCPPWNSGAGSILEIDPATNTTTLVGASLGANNYKYWKFVLAPNGKLYAFSNTGATNCQIMEFDPDTKTINFYGTYSLKMWKQEILAPNGKIYSGVLAGKFEVFDTETKTFESIDSKISNASTVGLVLAANGKLYGIAGTNDTILPIWEIDPETNKLRQVGTIPNAASVESYWDLTLALNGKLYVAPLYAAKTLEIETFPKTTDFGAYLKLPAQLS